MRGKMFSVLALLGLGGWAAAQTPSPWVSPVPYQPDSPRVFGYAQPNGFGYHRPHLYRHYYTPPNFMPDGRATFGYTPHDSFRYRVTPSFNTPHIEQNGQPVPQR